MRSKPSSRSYEAEQAIEIGKLSLSLELLHVAAIKEEAERKNDHQLLQLASKTSDLVEQTIQHIENLSDPSAIRKEVQDTIQGMVYGLYRHDREQNDAEYKRRQVASQEVFQISPKYDRVIAQLEQLESISPSQEFRDKSRKFRNQLQEEYDALDEQVTRIKTQESLSNLQQETKNFAAKLGNISDRLQTIYANVTKEKSETLRQRVDANKQELKEQPVVEPEPVQAPSKKKPQRVDKHTTTINIINAKQENIKKIVGVVMFLELYKDDVKASKKGRNFFFRKSDFIDELKKLLQPLLSEYEKNNKGESLQDYLETHRTGFAVFGLVSRMIDVAKNSGAKSETSKRLLTSIKNDRMDDLVDASRLSSYHVKK